METVQPQIVQPQTQIPGIGSYLLAIFLTPIYCLMRKKYIGFVLSTILYISAFLTFMIFGLGFVFWAVAAIPAAFSLRNEIIEAHASRTGEETAKALKAAGIGTANHTNEVPFSSVESVHNESTRSLTSPADAQLGGEKTCPMCAETVKSAARICKHCRHEFDMSPLTVADIPPVTECRNQYEDYTDSHHVNTVQPAIGLLKSVSEMPNQSSVASEKQPINQETSKLLIEPFPQENNGFQTQKSSKNVLGYSACVIVIIIVVCAFYFINKSNKVSDKSHTSSETASLTLSGQINPSLSNDEKICIFDELLSKCSDKYQKETRSEFTGSVDKYLDISPIKLSKNKQTYLVTGNALPFVGANKSFCWVYEKTGKKMLQIANLELCEDIKPSKSKHNGYADIHDLMHSGAAGTLYKTIYQFNGIKYQEKRSR